MNVRLRPRSLRGQLALLLIGVLLIAQLLSTGLHFRDRGEVLLHAAGFNTAERIAGLVRVLDSLEPEHRPAVVQALDLPPLRLHLSKHPIPLPKGDPGSHRARLFHRLLHFKLSERRMIRISVIESDTGEEPGLIAAWGPPMERGRRHTHRSMRQAHGMDVGIPPAPQTNFLAQVPLSRGQWVTFAYFLPQELATWPWDVLATLVILSVAVLLVSFFAVRWLVRPLSVLAVAADELGRDIHRDPLRETGPTEVRRAARAFNTMQRRVLRFVEERTRILAAVSHDLKTPITRMRLRLEIVEDRELKAKFEHDLADMQNMVQGSLDFMRGTAIEEPTKPVDMEALLESLMDNALDLGRSVEIEGRCLGPYPGKPLALKRCLTNLLDNALRYGSEAEITVNDDAMELHIQIRDRGPGLSEDELERVFEPFYRAEPSRNSKTGGTGLGLSIARNIAHAHGGDLTLRNHRGGGLEANLMLPR